MINKIKSLIIKFFIDKRLIKKNIVKWYTSRKNEKRTFKPGILNEDKKFYVINRDRGGLFSVFFYVLDHLKYAEKKGYIPVVDIENFSSFNSEAEPVNGTKNTWLYYFTQVSKFKLSEVYKSKTFFFSTNNDILDENGRNKYFQKETDFTAYYQILNKYFEIQPNIYDLANEFYLSEIKGYKVLGIHWRGSDYYYSPGHAFPATKNQIINLIDFYIKEENYEKIFVVTEDKKKLEILKKRYGNKISFYNSFRTDDPNDFLIPKRPLHKFKLGLESLIEVIIFSKLNKIVGINSNIVNAAIVLSNNKTKFVQIKNGWNSQKFFWSSYKWYFLNLLPSFLGGFDDFKNLKNRK